MSSPSPESDPTEDIFHTGLEALRYLNLPGIGDVIHDVHWAMYGDNLGSETPNLDQSLRDEKQLDTQDLARTSPEVQLAAQGVVEAWSELAWSLGKFVQAKGEFYKTFGDARHGEEKKGDFDFSNVNTPDDL